MVATAVQPPLRVNDSMILMFHWLQVLDPLSEENALIMMTKMTTVLIKFFSPDLHRNSAPPYYTGLLVMQVQVEVGRNLPRSSSLSSMMIVVHMWWLYTVQFIQPQL